MTERVGTLAFRCTLCDGVPDWRLSRMGDAAVAWACSPHLAHLVDDLLVKHYTHLRLTRASTPKPEVER